MSFLIKGADISPDHIQCITVFPEGFAIVEEYEMGLRTEATKCEVAPVPTPHGRLIDADDFDSRIRAAGGMADEELTDDFKDGVLSVLALMKTQNTVIEAEEG